tara:strand:- start:549 stop:1058 length:510 start_codon:yes stop_codon:yes gene_type:complete
MKIELPSQEILNEHFIYNPINGKLYNRIDRNPIARKGAEAGTMMLQGYRKLSMDSVKYYVHRIIWKMVTGNDPAEELDHVNHSRSDNRMDNLREVTRSENQQNASKRKDNVSGVTGVHWHKANSKWKADIQVEGNRLHLGSFTQRWHAIRARKLAEIGYGFHQNHGKTA